MTLTLCSHLAVDGQILKYKDRNLAHQAGLEYVRAMQFSADNKLAYTASDGGFGVFDFDATTGKLTLKQLQNMQVYGYTAMGGNNIVFSHDGKFGYATVPYSTNMYVFQRDPLTGKLTFLHQVEGIIDQFSTRSVIHISPDDQFLYIGGGVLNIYRRNPSNGSLAHVSREYYSVQSSDMYITQDGKRMYLSSSYMRVYDRDVNTGMISLLEEHYEWGNALGGVGAMAVTPDEKYIFAGTVNKGIARFAIDPSSGKLTYLGLFNYPRTEDIYNPLGPVGVNGVAMNPDANRLYVSSYRNMTSYAVDGAGGLTLLDKIAVESVPNDPYFGLAVSRNAEYIFGFGSGFRETSVECFKENSDSKLESVRIHYFKESLNRALFGITAEAISADDQYIYAVSSIVDLCVASFHSGVSNHGVISEISRLSFEELHLPDGMSVKEIILSSDGKNIYLLANKYNSPYYSILIVLDVASTGVLSYRKQIVFASGVWDIQMTIDNQFFYVASDDQTLAIYQRDLSGELTFKQKLTTTEMGQYWAPDEVMTTADGQWLFVKSVRDRYSPTQLFQFKISQATGELQFIKSTTLSAGGDKQAITMMLREEHQLFYTINVYSAGITAYTWNADTGDLGKPQGNYGTSAAGRWVGKMPGDDLLAINEDGETKFFMFYPDGTAVYNGSERKTGVISWTNGGGESGEERFLFPKTGNLVYAIRPSGNGIYVYEYQRNEIPPLPPTNVQASASGDGQIFISWDKNVEGDVTGYEIYRDIFGHTTPGSNTLKVGQATGTTFTDGTAQLNAGYYYWVKALATDKSSNYSARSNGISNTDSSPSAPSSVSLQAGDKFLKLIWSPNADTDLKNYVVYRNTSNSLAGAVEQITTTATTFIDGTVNYGQNYFYWIKAVDRNLNRSAASNVVSGMPVDSPPAKPAGVDLAAGDRFLKLTWAANTEADLNSYIVFRNTINDFAGAVKQTTTTASSFKDEDVSYEQRYYYWIKAVDQRLNESAASNVASGIPLDFRPFTPTQLIVITGDRYLQLKWNVNSPADGLNFEIYKGEVTGIENTSLFRTQTENELMDTEVQYLRQYYYYIRTIDQNGNRSPFSDVLFGTPIDSPPSRPTGLSAELTEEGINIRWDKNMEADLKGYKLFFDTEDTPENAEEIAVMGKDDTGFIYHTTENRSYFWLKAFDHNGHFSQVSEKIFLIVTAVENQRTIYHLAYPNPVKDFLYIKVNDEQCTYALFTMLGTPLMEGDIKSNHAIDLRDVRSGTYLCRIESPGKAYMFKIIKL